MPKYTQKAYQPRAAQGPILPQFVHDYLAYGAQKGDRNDTLFKVAAQYLHAGIAEPDIAPLLIARAVADGLSTAEAQKTITSAFNSQKKDPLGANGANGHQNRNQPHQPHSAPQPRKFVPGPSSTRPFSMPVPPPIPAGLKIYLEKGFQPGEGVSISGTNIGPDGKRDPGRGDLHTREEWLQKLAIKPVQKYYPGDEGIFIRINPTTGSHDSEVTAFRHGLFEADKDAANKPVPKEEQYAALVNSHLPCRFIVDSGDRSIHGIVVLDAPNRKEYDRRYALALSALEGHWICLKNKTPSRYSRVPGVNRRLYDNGKFIGIGRQELLAIDIGEASWEEWERKWTVDSTEEELAKFYSPRKIADFSQNYPPQLIEGLLYQGEKICLIGPSKSFKTWTLMDIFVCVANGIPFLGRFPTHKVLCLYMDFESLEASIRHRFEAIAKAHGLDAATAFDLLRISSFKGRLGTVRTDFTDPKVQKVMVKMLIDLGCGIYGADPLSHVMNGADENSNSAMTDIFMGFDFICRETHSSFASTHHFAKGSAFMKDPIDRGAGAGVLSGRAPGAAIIFTPHREPQCFTVDFIVRDFPLVDSFVVRRKHPLMEIDQNLDPKHLATPPSAAQPKIDQARKEERLNALMCALRVTEPDGLTVRCLKAASGIGDTTFGRYMTELTKKGLIFKSTLDDKFHLSPSQATAWGNTPH
jgi:RecA-family ATPase